MEFGLGMRVDVFHSCSQDSQARETKASERPELLRESPYPKILTRQMKLDNLMNFYLDITTLNLTIIANEPWKNVDFKAIFKKSL